MKINLALFCLIALTTFSCSNNSKSIKDDNMELIIEENHEIEKTEYSDKELKTSLHELNALNDEQELHLNSSNSTIENSADKVQKKAMKNSLRRLEDLNKEQEKFNNRKEQK